jgi:4-carboxymuconolactone decarboxylase
MAIREDARRNHAELFPDRQSKLAETDPELVELFDNWAFGDVLAEQSLDTRTRLMLQLAAFIACQAVGAFRVMVAGALNFGITPVEVKEVVYQAVPYVGMGKVFDFLNVTNEVLTSRGVGFPLPPQSTTTAETRFEKGLETQRQIFGERIEQMRSNAPKDQLHIQNFLAANCFGDYYTRSGLDLKLRELLTLAMLASLGGCEPQLSGHVAGNLAVGNERPTLVSAVTCLLPFIGYPRTLNALRIINEGTKASS